MGTNKIIEILTSLDVMKEAGSNSSIVDLQEKIEKASKNLRLLSYLAKAKKYFSIIGYKDSDIYVQTLHKSGTTLMQMMLYQMTTDGNMDFNHIYDVSPWTGSLAYLTKKDFEGLAKETPNFGERNIYKSHFEYSFYNDVKKGKFVYVIRDGFDQIRSFYHHHKNYSDSSLDFDEFVNRGMIEKWFRYNTEWIKNENNLNIIYVNYEDIIERKTEVIKKIAGFLEIDLDDEKIERVLKRSSFSFMKEYQHKFGEQPKGEDEDKIFNKFIRKGQAGKGKTYFTKEQRTKYNELSKEFLGHNELTKRYFINQ